VIRVGFAIDFAAESWLGGINYFKNLFDALYSLEERRIEPVVFVGTKADTTLFKDFPPVEMVRTRILDQRGVFRPLGYYRNLTRWLFSSDRLFKTMLERLLVGHGVELLSHSGSLKRGSSIPTLGWIADFQHMRMPEFFSSIELAARDRHFRDICENCSCVLVSSCNARDDLAEFAPDCVKRARVLNFVAGLGLYPAIAGAAELEQRYGFKGPYFYVPNQFWAHKNHRVILEALKTLKSEGKKVLVLATGNTNDHRQPGHFGSLMDYAEVHGLSDVFKVLGLVPRADVLSLMHNAVSLINPSFFEGWSTSVEEAKSMGKRIILSDIPVHREQDPPAGVFFDPRDPASLAGAMWELWSSRDPNVDEELMRRASKELPARRREFARRYEEIVLELVNQLQYHEPAGGRR
jgi:glycosyltransferase involved in cell wall biosynthesis